MDDGFMSPACFFAACAGAGYTFLKDDLANVPCSTEVSCCIRTLRHLCVSQELQSNVEIFRLGQM